ncbi:MAG: DUF4435 domain-containing protein [Rikenellaceae bacterium]|nr:DUF4435 domain-containing protein [Rikenellaceae bacterium]MCL2693115.1 DUF4435 domain-containing protein [Rikenellaceae bacterium]
MSRRTKQREYAARACKRERRQRGQNHDGVHQHEHHHGDAGHHGDCRQNFTGEKNCNNQGWNRFREEQLEKLPHRMPHDPHKKLVEVFVEGYEDVAFWRGIFDDFESDHHTFEINVPPREDLAKGKRVILQMIPEENHSPYRLLCVDSDFDYLFGNSTAQAHTVNSTPGLFHTYAYATENFVCYAPSLHNVCVKATKNDTRIFDFEYFLTEYSRTIYPLFLWYAYSAFLKTENVFTLLEFKNAVKLNYLETDNNGHSTLEWLARQVEKWLAILHDRYADLELTKKIEMFEQMLVNRGLRPEDTYMYIQGHTLLDNVVMVILNAVCEQLRTMSLIRINTSTKTGIALKNEMSNYNNALRNVRDVLLDNEAYKDCPLYLRLRNDIENYLLMLDSEI